MTRRAGASVEITAFHTDLHMNEGRHSHTWTVTIWRDAQSWFDLRSLREAAKAVAASLVEGDDLRPEFWSSEAIADAFLTIANVVRVTVDRPGFHIDFSR